MRGSSFPWGHGPLGGLHLGLYPGSSVAGWCVEGHLGIPQSETLGAKIGVGAGRLVHVLPLSSELAPLGLSSPDMDLGPPGVCFCGAGGWQSSKILKHKRPGTSWAAFGHFSVPCRSTAWAQRLSAGPRLPASQIHLLPLPSSSRFLVLGPSEAQGLSGKGKRNPGWKGLKVHTGCWASGLGGSVVHQNAVCIKPCRQLFLHDLIRCSPAGLKDTANNMDTTRRPWQKPFPLTLSLCLALALAGRTESLNS